LPSLYALSGAREIKPEVVRQAGARQAKTVFDLTAKAVALAVMWLIDAIVKSNRRIIKTDPLFTTLEKQNAPVLPRI